MVKKTAWKIEYPNVSGNFYNKMLSSRQLTPDELDSTMENMHSCFDVPDMDLAVFTISMAVRGKQKIIILGDYDVDGTMATTELVRFFRLINMNVDYYIPDRLNEGYGMSDKSVDYIIENGYGLVITVDNGIAAISQIKKLMDNGISVVVTDHHECKEELPPACAVMDCKRPDSKYPFSELCGAGVVLKLIQSLSIEFKLPRDTWLDFLEYATLASVADVVPLVDENRVLVKEGIERIKKSNKPAIRNLLRVAGKIESLNSLSTDDIGYYIAPLINASSRVGDVHVAMRLLLTDDEKEAVEYADKLKEFNDKRKKIEKEIKDEANKSLLTSFDFNSVNPVICYGDDWHIGVIGIVASSMVNAYNRPAIILSKDKDGIYHGSCRTYEDISIIDMLDSASAHILSYGGHKEAAGLKVSESELQNFIDAINAYARQNFSEDMFVPYHKASFAVKLEDVTIENIKKLNEFAPFGKGNEAPVFVCSGVEVTSFRKIGKKEGAEGAHLQLTLKNNGISTPVDAIGFYKGLYTNIMQVGDKVSVMFTMNINEWQGKETAQIMITDIQLEIPSKAGLTDAEDDLFLYDGVTCYELAEEYNVPIEDYCPDIALCRWVYTAIKYFTKTESVIVSNIDIFSYLISVMGKRDVNMFKLKRTLEILAEAGYFYFKPMPAGRFLLAEIENPTPRKISETETYNRLQLELEESHMGV